MNRYIPLDIAFHLIKNMMQIAHHSKEVPIEAAEPEIKKRKMTK